jgi:hypothetical protein
MNLNIDFEKDQLGRQASLEKSYRPTSGIVQAEHEMLLEKREELRRSSRPSQAAPFLPDLVSDTVITQETKDGR